VALRRANNDRAAGFVRLAELLHVEPGRLRPPWAGGQGDVGAPRLYVFAHCENLLGQLQNAPLEVDGALAGKAVEARWEGSTGMRTRPRGTAR
jgi:hypothetical protein